MAGCNSRTPVESASSTGAGAREHGQATAEAGERLRGGCRKEYRALLAPGRLALAVGESLHITTPIGRRPHPLLGEIWCAAEAGDANALTACSTLTLLRRHRNADLVEVAIATGRPHQIRIHCAAVGAPLLGDPLYLPGGLARPGALPGEGGYKLHAQRLRLLRPEGTVLELEASHCPDIIPDA
jgi:23S rRNA pseudouridine1911/1915/1917 synthase